VVLFNGYQNFAFAFSSLIGPFFYFILSFDVIVIRYHLDTTRYDNAHLILYKKKVIPNLGVWVPPELFTGGSSGGDGTGGSGLVLCDVPGLIEGAATGKGLGHAFLRHVERCHVILHLVDATSSDPVGDFKMLNGELIKYGTGQLARMPQVVVINKIDTYDDYENNSDYSDSYSDNNNDQNNRFSLEELEIQLKEAMSHSRLMQMSAKEEDGVDDLMKRLATFVKKVT
jgi:GTP-binding protein